MKVIFFGTDDFVLGVFHFLTINHQLLAAVTTPDQLVGRHQTLTPSPIKVAAQAKNIPVFTPEKLDQDTVSSLQQLKPDLIVVASYGKIIPQAILDIPKLGALNIHPSLLPKYRGATPVQSAILNGDAITGVTVIKMDDKMDHGPIVVQKEFSIDKDDTFESLVNSLFDESAQLLPAAIEKLANKDTLQEQNHDDATFVKLIKKEDGFFEIENPPAPEKLNQMIRAYFPWPNAWTKWNGKVVKLYPGNLVQIEGKKAVSVKDFLNGYPDFPLKDF